MTNKEILSLDSKNRQSTPNGLGRWVINPKSGEKQLFKGSSERIRSLAAVKHTVQSKETLATILTKYCNNDKLINETANLNKLNNPDLIQIGQSINIDCSLTPNPPSTTIDPDQLILRVLVPKVCKNRQLLENFSEKNLTIKSVDLFFVAQTLVECSSQFGK